MISHKETHRRQTQAFLMGANQAGTLCLAISEIPDSLKESKYLPNTISIVQTFKAH
jgi:hypothetical protein